MAIEVTLAIEPSLIALGESKAIVANRLANLGSQFVRWRQEVDGTPASTVFKFVDNAEMERFLGRALEMPGVSVATHHPPSQRGQYPNDDLETAAAACRRLAERNRQAGSLRQASHWDRMADRIERGVGVRRQPQAAVPLGNVPTRST